MKTKDEEFEFRGQTLNGFFMLIVELFIIPGIIAASWFLFQQAISIVVTVVLALLWFINMFGFVKQEPNEARCMLFFGEYKGTFRKNGYFWVNPFLSAKKLSLRARNLNPKPIKVNDKIGNPILIGMVLVWRLKDTYKAMFDIDAETMAETANQGAAMPSSLSSRMKAFESFVKVQSDAALRQVAGQYAYDSDDEHREELTLRDGSVEINEQLVMKLNERLAMSGMEVVEARINYLAYAPEIAAVMLRRQQASAVIAAREKIVEGAVSMVNMAIAKLEKDNIVQLDNDKKAAMVSNLMVVLCADEAAQPVVNTGAVSQ